MIETLLQTTGLNSLVALCGAAAVWVASRSGLRPAWLHLLWFALLLRLVMPPLWPIELLPRLATADSAPATSAFAVDSSFGTNPRSLAGDTVSYTAVGAGEPDTAAFSSPSFASQPRPSSISWHRVRAIVAGWPWRGIVGGVWLAGAVGWWLLAWRRLLRFHRALGDGEDVRSALCGAAGVPVRLIDARISPCLWAFAGRAWIAFPRALYETLPVAERELILRHELAHYRRRDHWVRWVEFVVLGLQWWNPLAWWIANRLRDAEEAACDARVAAAVPDERRAYATALVRTADFLVGEDAWSAPRLATGASSLAPLKRRLHTILDAAPPPRRAALAWLLLGGAGVALAVTPTPQPPALTADAPQLAPVFDDRRTVEPPHRESAREISDLEDHVPASPASARSVEGKAAADSQSAVSEESDDPESTPEPQPASGTEEKSKADSSDRPDAQNAASDSKPDGDYLKAYLLVGQAEKYKAKGWSESAVAAYREALAIFDEISAKWPEWLPSMVNYRRKLTIDDIAALTPALNKSRRYFVSSEERVAAAQVVAAFLAADSIDGRLQFVRFGERMRPRLEAWHRTRRLLVEEVVDDDLASALSKWLEVDGMRFIVVTAVLARTRAAQPSGLEETTTREYQLFALEETPDGFKIDWETSVGWQPTALADFKKGLAKSPQVLRVQVRPGDYYNGPFADEAVWQCFALTYPADNDFSLFGYVRRDSAVGRQLAELVDGMMSVPLILELSRQPAAADNQALIERLVHTQWFLKDGPLSVPEP